MKHKNKNIPEQEAWLYRNKKALKAVQEGIKQAKKGQVTKGPDLLEFQDKNEQ